jgi:hypothetical protein
MVGPHDAKECISGDTKSHASATSSLVEDLSDIKFVEKGHNNATEKIETKVKKPGHNVSEFFRSLQSDYGIRFLILTSLVAHWLKGFCRAQSQHSIRYLLQLWGVPGPQLDTYQSIADLPWSLKPLIAILSDMFPIFGFKKIPYVTIATGFGISGLCVTSFLSPTSTPVQAPVIGLFLANFCWMTADILIEGLAARRMAEHPESGPNFVMFISIGQQVTFLLSSVISGMVFEKCEDGPQLNISLCLVPTILSLYPMLANFGGETRIRSCREARINQWRNQKTIILISITSGILCLLYALVGIMVHDTTVIFSFCLFILFTLNSLTWASFTPAVGRLVLFLGIVSATNLSISGPAQYFYTDTVAQYPEGPHLEPWFFVTVCGIVGSVVAIIASCIYALFKQAKYRFVYIAIILLNATLSAPNSFLFSRLNLKWGIPDHWFVATDTAFQTAVQALFYAPALLLLSRVSPDQMESSMFAILAANSNLASTISGPISGFICQLFGITPDGSANESSKFENMWKANILMSCIKLTPLAFVWLLPNISMCESLDNVRSAVTRNSPINRFFAYRMSRRRDMCSTIQP